MTSPNGRTMLLCPPTYFDIRYEINPWMRLGEQVDRERALRQWSDLRATLERLGVRVETIEPHPDYPDMVFTGDGGLALGRRFVVSNFRPEERRGEAALFRSWFEGHGFEIVELPGHVFFEGLGDIVVHGGEAIVSYGIRTSDAAVAHLEEALPEVAVRARLELVDERFFHIGVALSILDDETILYVPDAFAPGTRREIERLAPRVIPLDDEDAESFAVNAIVVGRALVLHRATNALRRRLEQLGFEVLECDVGEFLKSGGGTRCLVLPLS